MSKRRMTIDDPAARFTSPPIGMPVLVLTEFETTIEGNVTDHVLNDVGSVVGFELDSRVTFLDGEWMMWREV